MKILKENLKINERVEFTDLLDNKEYAQIYKNYSDLEAKVYKTQLPVAMYNFQAMYAKALNDTAKQLMLRSGEYTLSLNEFNNTIQGCLKDLEKIAKQLEKDVAFASKILNK